MAEQNPCATDSNDFGRCYNSWANECSHRQSVVTTAVVATRSPFSRAALTSRGFSSVLVLLLVVLGLWLSLSGIALAAPVAPISVVLTQPDGTTFEAQPWGDEWRNGYETDDGYTVVKDEATGFWQYAVLDEAGELAPSGVCVGQPVPTNLPLHLRPGSLPGGPGPNGPASEAVPVPDGGLPEDATAPTGNVAPLPPQ